MTLGRRRTTVSPLRSSHAAGSTRQRPSRNGASSGVGFAILRTTEKHRNWEQILLASQRVIMRPKFIRVPVWRRKSPALPRGGPAGSRIWRDGFICSRHVQCRAARQRSPNGNPKFSLWSGDGEIESTKHGHERGQGQAGMPAAPKARVFVVASFQLAM